MAEFNTQYYQGNDQYSDGEIEEKILQIVQEGKSLEESGDRSFPVLYHLSPVRENILSWYGFREGARVLEIGAGPGAITSLLARRCAHVTSVELSKRRAMINYERNRASENLTIMVGNLNDMRFPGRFDYVILNGVFEYAGSFTEGADPYGTFLKRCAGYLKEDGLLLIAIENRLGLKYFAGAPEDHTANYMEGLRNYPDNPSVHTFSRGEWERMLKRCGLPYYRFYYPCPDYKFPNEILTGETISAEGFGRNAWNFNPDRLELFSEQEMGQTLVSEGVMERFMNSFLIEAGTDAAGRAQEDEEVLYAKINADRAPGFRIQTLIVRGKDGKKRVIKKPLNDEAVLHLRRMHERELRFAETSALSGGRFSLLKGELLPDGSLAYPFLEQKSLGRRIGADAASIRHACTMLLERILENESGGSIDTEAFTRLFGKARPADGTRAWKLVSPANIDLIFDNIFPGEDHEYVIDGEWITDTPVPALFLLWRAVNELYASRRNLERILPQKTLLKEFGIHAADRQLFWSWASHFEKEYVKANRLSEYAVPVRKADLMSLRWFGEEPRLTATLYLDRGAGWREEDSVHADVVVERGRYDVSFVIEDPGSVKAVRFDPLEGCACVCDLRTDAGVLSAMNASASGRHGKVFLTMDPSYRIRTKKIPPRIRVFGTVRTKDASWALERSRELLDRGRLKTPAAILRHVKNRLNADTKRKEL